VDTNDESTEAQGTPAVPELVNIPPDLALVGDEDLQALRDAAVAEFDSVEAGPVTADSVQHALRLSTDIGRIRAELAVRQQRAEVEQARQQADLAEQMQSLSTKVKGPGDGDGSGGGGGNGTGTGSAPSASIDVEAIAAAAARGTAVAMAAMQGKSGAEVATRISTSLAEASRHAPQAIAPQKSQLVVTASVDIPGVGQGQKLNFDQVVDAFQKRAHALPVSQSGMVDGGPTVVTVRNEFEHTLDDRTSPAQTEELFKFLTAPAKQEALVAGGGWCAPSEIRYDFFNVACEDGLIDLPTFGVSRGGIRFPVSPSLADVQLAPFVSGFGNTSNPWLWTETDDQATVTGTPNKPCIRVPCPSFDERRLECYGICLTAGNLTDDAYPEATANFLRLLMSAHAHAMNQRIISTMVSLSSAVVSGGDFAGTTSLPAYNQIVGGVALGALDYRARYGMCADDVLEVVMPYWVAGAIAADLGWRSGDTGDLLAVTLSEINGYFAAKNVRVQWVNDWQVRASGFPGFGTAMTAWPSSVDILMYAAGTFLLGNGLTLDLGVVRDSTLNAENDHTAAWSEECHLVARVGHESRQYRIGFSVNGAASSPVALGSNL
jgi:hypothetical protein